MRHSALILISLALIAACDTKAPTAGGAQASCATRAYAEIGGPIALVNQDGLRVTEADFKGTHSLVFFGFTYCPDICPTTLVTLRRALDRLPEEVPAPRTILISVDPERDTPGALKAYITNQNFPANITGLTGSDTAIRAAAEAFFADFQRIETPDSLADYTMDHTSLVYLMDENWQLKTFFDHTATDADIATCLAQLLS